MRSVNIITGILILIGALNWGIVGLFNYNVIGFLFGEASLLTRIVYVLVGLSGLWQLIRYRSVCACYWAPARTSTPVHGPVASH